jgi:hypothetical protein
MTDTEEQYILKIDKLFKEGLKKPSYDNYIEKNTNKFLNSSVRNCYLRHINAILNTLAHIRGDYYHDRLYTKKFVRSMFNNCGYTLDNIIDAQIIPRSSFTSSERIERIDRFLSKFLFFLASNYKFCAYKS